MECGKKENLKKETVNNLDTRNHDKAVENSSSNIKGNLVEVKSENKKITVCYRYVYRWKFDRGFFL